MMDPGVRGSILVSPPERQPESACHPPRESRSDMVMVAKRHPPLLPWVRLPQKALRGVIPGPLCPVLGAILWEIVVKS